MDIKAIAQNQVQSRICPSVIWWLKSLLWRRILLWKWSISCRNGSVMRGGRGRAWKKIFSSTNPTPSRMTESVRRLTVHSRAKIRLTPGLKLEVIQQDAAKWKFTNLFDNNLSFRRFFFIFLFWFLDGFEALLLESTDLDSLFSVPIFPVTNWALGLWSVLSASGRLRFLTDANDLKDVATTFCLSCSTWEACCDEPCSFPSKKKNKNKTKNKIEIMSWQKVWVYWRGEGDIGVY